MAMDLPTPPPSGRRANFCLHSPTSKPSLPIEIPARPKQASCPVRSPGALPSSPELIFDMSPVSFSDSPFSNHNYPPPGLCVPPLHGRLGYFSPPRQEMSPHMERFMYPFPTIPASGTDPLSKRIQEPIMAASPTDQLKNSIASEVCPPAQLGHSDQNFRPSPEPDALECTRVHIRGHVYPSYGRAPLPSKPRRRRLSLQNPKPDIIHFIHPDEYMATGDLDNTSVELEKWPTHWVEDGKPIRVPWE